MNRQHRFSNTIIRMSFRLIHSRRIKRHIMRQSRMQISLFIRHTQRRTRILPYFGNKANRCSTPSLPILRDACHFNCNGVNFTNTYQSSNRNSNIQFSNISMNCLSNNFNASQFTRHRNSSTQRIEAPPINNFLAVKHIQLLPTNRTRFLRRTTITKVYNTSQVFGRILIRRTASNINIRQHNVNNLSSVNGRLFNLNNLKFKFTKVQRSNSTITPCSSNRIKRHAFSFPGRLIRETRRNRQVGLLKCHSNTYDNKREASSSINVNDV